jgi:hypothetical protein
MSKRLSRELDEAALERAVGEGARGACRPPRDIARCRSPEDLHANSTLSPSFGIPATLATSPLLVPSRPRHLSDPPGTPSVR